MEITAPTVEQLDEAVIHLNYEVSTLVHQAMLLHIVDHQIAVDAIAPLIGARSGWSVLPILDQMAGSSIDALAEASLLHLLLIDDFLGGPRQEGRVVAEDYGEEWLADRFLSDGDITLISTQLHRLGGRGERGARWPIAAMTMAMVARFEQFLDSVPPERWSQLAGADIACQMARVTLPPLA